MKIYSNTTSERATKGQGGNKFLKTTLNIGSTTDSRHVATFLMNVVNDKVILQIWIKDETGDLREATKRFIFPLNSKGKSQKDEKDFEYLNDSGYRDVFKN